MTSRRSNLGLLRLWAAEQLRLTLRAPQAIFFTVVFPLMLLTLFSALLQGPDGLVTVAGGEVAFAQFFTPSIAAFATLTSCFTGITVGMAMERDAGILKRVRSTPLPTPVFIAARVVDKLLLALAAAVVLFSVGVLAFGVHVYPRLLPAAIVTFLVGAVSFCALGMALGAVVPTASSAVPIVNLVVLPMMVLSGVFSPLEQAPAWLQHVADVFPLSHLVRALGGAFSPHSAGWAFSWPDLAILLAWGAAGALIAAWRFRWEPAQAGTRGRGGRRRRAFTRA
jgi:ABC-2 type transport system permease protein